MFWKIKNYQINYYSTSSLFKCFIGFDLQIKSDPSLRLSVLNQFNYLKCWNYYLRFFNLYILFIKTLMWVLGFKNENTYYSHKNRTEFSYHIVYYEKIIILLIFPINWRILGIEWYWTNPRFDNYIPYFHKTEIAI